MKISKLHCLIRTKNMHLFIMLQPYWLPTIRWEETIHAVFKSMTKSMLSIKQINVESIYILVKLWSSWLIVCMFEAVRTFENSRAKGASTRSYTRLFSVFTSYFCTCTSFSASYTYKSTCACTSTTSSNHVGFFVRRTRVRRTNVRACCIQMSLLSSLAFQIKWCFYKIYTINCYTNTNYILIY